MHVGQKDAALIMCKHKLMIASYLSPILYIQLVLKVKHQVDSSCCWVCHVLPKEHPGAFYDVPWGLYKELPSNNHTSVRYCISHN